MNIRTGLGFDTHAFTDDPAAGPLQLACVSWPGERALAGHSDGDVAAHALCDALLSAAGLGDLGLLVGVDDPAMAGVTGQRLLELALTRVREAGWEPVNAVIQVVGNRPKLSPRRAEIQQRLSEICGMPVSIAGTTTDALGFTGRGEGIAAIANVLLTR